MVRNPVTEGRPVELQKARPIELLALDVSEKIAAGEVIERPASVVKELVENSLDAGATEIAVILEDGGKALIEVIDNGCGMNAQDLRLSVKRHATSKLRALDDLNRLQTLGFRGEALPSVAAVSHLNLISRSHSASQAYELDLPHELLDHGKVDAEPITFGHFLGSPHGTRIRATGLFSQIPARLKFLRSQSAEVSQVRDWLERLALTHPETGFRLVSNDRTLLNLRPQDLKSRVRSVLADDKDYPVIAADNLLEFGESPSVRVQAYWLQGMSSPHTKKLIQVVNSRAVKDKLVQQALLSPFRQALLPGQFPAICLFIEVDPAELDVNAHPTKTEIRFLESRKIFRAVESLIASMIASHGASGFAAGRADQSETRPDGRPSPGYSSTPLRERSSHHFAPANWRASQPGFNLSSEWAPREESTSGQITREMPNEEQNAPESPVQAHPFHFGRYIGAAFNTYLLYDLGSELGLIDQHAAHERIRFEALKKRTTTPEGAAPSQALLIPEAIRFKPEERTLIEERLPWLDRLGFEAEIFGEETVLIRSIPGEWGTESLKTRLQNLIERLIGLESVGEQAQLAWDENLFEKLASEACHSAIRAGDRLDSFEAEKLLTELFRCEHPWNCPHGRPTTVRVPKGRFEEWFQRRV